MKLMPLKNIYKKPIKCKKKSIKHNFYFFVGKK